MEKEGLTPKEMDSILNKKSGILGIHGTTSDNREVEAGAKAGNYRCKLIENMLCHQLTKYVGSFIAAMGGADAVVFTGGIGENNPAYRTRVAEKLAFLGVKVDEEKNHIRGEEVDITTPDSPVKLLVIPTDEELMIARDTLELTSK
jgi:acetate kinase